MKKEVVKIALAEVGYKETPANSNLNKYGEWYGKNGVAWCAAFVSWVYFHAGMKWPKNLETSKGFVWCPTLTIRARKNGWVTTKPEPGDVVLFDWNNDGGADHVGIFIKWVVEGKTFETVEGNTSLNNQSNGGAVMKRVRKIEHVQHFVKV
jgi:hypothetical protein